MYPGRYKAGKRNPVFYANGYNILVGIMFYGYGTGKGMRKV